MLDTIILQLNVGTFQILDYGRFGTTKEEVLNTRSPFFKWCNNPTKQDKKDDIYMPRLTLIKRGSRFFLKIEFSAPKLLFKNNLDELKETDFARIVAVLQDKLKSMGVLIWTKNIEQAPVLSFHPSKNIELEKGYTAKMAIKELGKFDFSKRFDIDKKNYRNNGEVLQLYTRTHSLVIYDKICDLKKPPKRAIDKEQTKYQMSLFDYIKEKNSRLEILRIEARLCTKTKMNAMLKKTGYAVNPVFKDIFKTEMCQNVLAEYWDHFFSDNIFLLSTNSNPQSILQLIFMCQPKTKIIRAITNVGLYMLCRDDEGMRGFRQIIESYRPKTNWAVVKRSLKEFEDEIFSNSLWGFVKAVKLALKNFNSFKLKNNEAIENEKGNYQST